MDTQKLSLTGLGFVFAFECTPYDDIYSSMTPSPVSRSSCDTFLSPQHIQSQTIVSATIATQNTTAATTTAFGDQQLSPHKHERAPTNSLSSKNTFNSHTTTTTTPTPLTPSTPSTITSATQSSKNHSTKKSNKLKKKKNLIFRGNATSSSNTNNNKQQQQQQHQVKRVEVSPRLPSVEEHDSTNTATAINSTHSSTTICSSDVLEIPGIPNTTLTPPSSNDAQTHGRATNLSARSSASSECVWDSAFHGVVIALNRKTVSDVVFSLVILPYHFV